MSFLRSCFSLLNNFFRNFAAGFPEKNSEPPRLELRRATSQEMDENNSELPARRSPVLKTGGLGPSKKVKIVIDFIFESCDKPHFN